jgi:hypothetical protein
LHIFNAVDRILNRAVGGDDANSAGVEALDRGAAKTLVGAPLGAAVLWTAIVSMVRVRDLGVLSRVCNPADGLGEERSLQSAASDQGDFGWDGVRWYPDYRSLVPHADRR